MSSFEEKVEDFAQKLIEQHGFRLAEGFSCLIPDKDKSPSKEGLFLWGFSQKRMRFETKIEKFHAPARIKKMEEMLGVSEKDYKKIFSAIEDYLKSLKEIGFKDIGKGVVLFDKTKLYNVQADASFFEKKLSALRKFELLTLDNPIIKFVEEYNYFKVKDQDELVWDKEFGRTSSSSAAASSKSKTAKSSTSAAKTSSTKTTATKKVSGAKTTATKRVSNVKSTVVKKASSAKAAKPTAPKKASSATAAKPTAPKKASRATAAKPTAPKKVSSAKAVKPTISKNVSSAKAAKPTAMKKASSAKAAKPTAPKKASTAKAIVTKPTTPKKVSGTRAKSSVSSRKTPSRPSRTVKTPLADKLKKLATSQPESILDEEKQKNVWTQQVDTLYKNVQSWLSALQKNGYITFNTHTTQLPEENLGAYSINSLELVFVGGHKIIFKPIEMNILGSVGRVDIFHRGYNSHRVMLLLHDDNSWELCKGFKKEEQQSFDKDNLETLLNQWIES